MNNRGKLLCNNKKFSDFLDKLYKNNSDVTQSQSLESLLILPVQRIPRYKLLLEQLLKYTDESHSDYENINNTLHEIQQIAIYNNEAIRKRENKTKLMSIMMLIEPRTRVDLLDSDNRRFIKEGALLRQCRRGLKEFQFWLLNDQLLYGQGTPLGVYILNRQIHLSKCFVSPCESIYENQCSFIVESPQKSFIVITPNVKERNEWIEAITNAIQEQRVSLGTTEGKLAPLWSPDATSSSCQKCKTGFSMFFRRHHCRNCGAIVCDNCSNKRFKLEHVDSKKQVRVCNDCYDFLTSGKPNSRRSRRSIDKQNIEEAVMDDYYDSDDAEGDKANNNDKVKNVSSEEEEIMEKLTQDGDNAALSARLESLRISRVVEMYRDNIQEEDLQDFHELLNNPEKMKEITANIDPNAMREEDITIPEDIERQIRLSGKGRRAGNVNTTGNSIYSKHASLRSSSIYSPATEESYGEDGTSENTERTSNSADLPSPVRSSSADSPCSSREGSRRLSTGPPKPPKPRQSQRRTNVVPLNSSAMAELQRLDKESEQPIDASEDDNLKVDQPSPPSKPDRPKSVQFKLQSEQSPNTESDDSPDTKLSIAARIAAFESIKK